MPLNRLSICIVRKVAISGVCEEYRSQDRLINPTEAPLGPIHVCSGLPGPGGGITQERIRIRKTLRLENSIISSADNRVVQPSRPA